MFKKTLLFVLLCTLLFTACGTTQETQQTDTAAPPQQETTLDENNPLWAFADYERFSEKSNTWYTDNNLIIHATGGINGLSYTNSKEAMELSLKNGYRLIEVDFNYTTDNRLVCVHNWTDAFFTLKETPDYKTFMQLKIQGKYTPISAENVIEYMKKYKDLYIVIDSKHDDLSTVVSTLLEIAKKPEIMNRFIVQLYKPGEKANIENVYDFPDDNYLFTCYKFSTDPTQILPLIYDENINVVTIKTEVLDEETLEFFMNKNIYVYEHTVNRPDKAQARLDKGVWGLYTDFIEEGTLKFRK